MGHPSPGQGCGALSQAPGCALGGDQGVELVQCGFGGGRSGWLADVIGLPRRMAVIRKLWVGRQAARSVSVTSSSIPVWESDLSSKM